MDLFFMSFETRKRIKTRLGLFFTSLEMRERVGVRVDLFFMSLETRKRIKTLTDYFFINIFSSHQRTYNKPVNFLKIGDLATLWYNGKS